MIVIKFIVASIASVLALYIAFAVLGSLEDVTPLIPTPILLVLVPAWLLGLPAAVFFGLMRRVRNATPVSPVNAEQDAYVNPDLMDQATITEDDEPVQAIGLGTKIVYFLAFWAVLLVLIAVYISWVARTWHSGTWYSG